MEGLKGENMIAIGDKVTFNDKYYVPDRCKNIEYTVVQNPKDVCGTLSIWLEELTGCYAVDGFDKVIN